MIDAHSPRPHSILAADLGRELPDEAPLLHRVRRQPGLDGLRPRQVRAKLLCLDERGLDDHGDPISPRRQGTCVRHIGAGIPGLFWFWSKVRGPDSGNCPPLFSIYFRANLVEKIRNGKPLSPSDFSFPARKECYREKYQKLGGVTGTSIWTS